MLVSRYGRPMARSDRRRDDLSGSASKGAGSLIDLFGVTTGTSSSKRPAYRGTVERAWRDVGASLRGAMAGRSGAARTK